MTILLAWLASQISPAWTTRYFAVVLGPILLVGARGLVAPAHGGSSLLP